MSLETNASSMQLKFQEKGYFDPQFLAIDRATLFGCGLKHVTNLIHPHRGALFGIPPFCCAQAAD